MKDTEEMMKPKMTFSKVLRFTPYAWAKLIWMRDRGDTEVAGYGITATEDPLLVTDFRLVKQECTSVEFHFDPEDGAEFMELMLDEGLMPWQYSNILIHTHPGDSPTPSPVDETNFGESFSHPNWATMFILAKGGNAYCRMKVNIGPGIVIEMISTVDWSIPFIGSNVDSWASEYEDKVSEMKFTMTGREQFSSIHSEADEWHDMARDAERDGILTTNEDESNDAEMFEEGEGDIFWDGTYLTVWDDDDELFYCYDPEKEEWFTVNEPELVKKSHELDKPWIKNALDWAKKNPQEVTEAVG